jgi:hypothetical protein
LIQVGRAGAATLVSNRAAASQIPRPPWPLRGVPPVATITKYDPSGEKSTSRTWSWSFGAEQATSSGR